MKLRIEPKKKPCYGTTPETRGYGCGKLTYHRHYGLGKMCCYPKWLLETEAGRLKIEKAKTKATAPRKELEREKVLRNNDRSLEWLKINVRTICHDYIKLRDKGRPCVSCGAPWNPDFQAGHFYKAELFSTLKYHWANIHGQCVRCNGFLDGNHQEYSLRIHERIGSDGVNELKELAAMDKQLNFKWDREELKKIREYYKSKIKEL